PARSIPELEEELFRSQDLKTGDTPLLYATRRGDISMMQILLEKMPPNLVAVPDNHSRTVLHLLARWTLEGEMADLLDEAHKKEVLKNSRSSMNIKGRTPLDEDDEEKDLFHNIDSEGPPTLPTPEQMLSASQMVGRDAEKAYEVQGPQTQERGVSSSTPAKATPMLTFTSSEILMPRSQEQTPAMITPVSSSDQVAKMGSLKHNTSTATASTWWSAGTTKGGAFTSPSKSIRPAYNLTSSHDSLASSVNHASSLDSAYSTPPALDIDSPPVTPPVLYFNTMQQDQCRQGGDRHGSPTPPPAAPYLLHDRVQEPEMHDQRDEDEDSFRLPPAASFITTTNTVLHNNQVVEQEDDTTPSPNPSIEVDVDKILADHRLALQKWHTNR
ncbi:unnamed protein product, partial [Amoebophrya sp. A25]